VASVLAACGSSPATPDAVVVAPDASVIDATPIDAPLDVAPTAWVVEQPETRTVFAAAVVPGGFVFGGLEEMFRITDDGAGWLRRPVPDGWYQYSLTATRDGDLYAVVWTDPDPRTLIARLDGASLDVEWTYLVGDGDDPYAKVVDAGDGRTLAVVSTHNWGGSQIWTLHDIDATGVGTTRPLDLPNGYIDALFVRDDGIVESSWRAGNAAARWQLDPVDGTWTTTPFTTTTACDDMRSTVTGAGLLLHALGGDIPQQHEVAMIIGADGSTVMSETLVSAGLVGRGTFVGATRIVGLDTTRVWDAPRANATMARERILPLRPGGYAIQSVMASDGERAFVAWLDQVSTFDTVLRVTRLGELH
jgi:hypothetical protein